MKKFTSIIMILGMCGAGVASPAAALRPRATEERKQPTHGELPLFSWVGTPHFSLKEAVDRILNSEAQDIKNLQHRITQQGIKIYLVSVNFLPGDVKFRTILVDDEEVRKEITKAVGHQIPENRGYLIAISSAVMDEPPDSLKWKIKHELYHIVYPPLQLEMQWKIITAARNTNDELLSKGVQGVIGSLDDLDLLRRMLRGGDEEDAVIEVRGRLEALRYKIIEYKDAPSWLKKTQDYARMIINGFASEYLMEVMPFRLKGKADIANELEGELTGIFRTAGIKEEYIQAGRIFANDILRNTPSDSIYPTFTALADIVRQLEKMVSDFIVAQFIGGNLAELFSNNAEGVALSQI